MAVGSVKIIILLASKGFYFFFFREILTLVNRNSPIGEVTSEDNSFCSPAALILCMSCLIRHSAAVSRSNHCCCFFKRNKFLNENNCIFYFSCRAVVLVLHVTVAPKVPTPVAFGLTFSTRGGPLKAGPHTDHFLPCPQVAQLQWAGPKDPSWNLSTSIGF